MAAAYGGAAFAKGMPGPAAVDRFAIDLKPITETAEQIRSLIRDDTVGPGPDIQQQISILADNVYQVVNQRCNRFEFVVFNIAPGFVADGGGRFCQ